MINKINEIIKNLKKFSNIYEKEALKNLESESIEALCWKAKQKTLNTCIEILEDLVKKENL